MAIVAADWTIDRATGAIRYIGDDHGGASPSYATVIEFHRWLMDLADDAASTGDDELDITDTLPSQRSTDNIVSLLGSYNIDDTAAEHLFDGSIIQSSGAEIYDGVVNFGNAGIAIQIIQNGSVLTDDWWNANGGLNANAAGGISHRFMIKVRTGGADIDGRKLIGISREYGKTYSEFVINATSRGNNVLALSNSDDLNNQTAIGTIAALADISNLTEGFASFDVDNNGTPENYYSEWDIGANSINTFYERMKWLTRDGSASTLYGLNGELFRGITHEITYGSLAGGNFADSTSVTFGNGATAQILADNGTNKFWMQILTGTAPTASDSITQGGVTATVSSVTGRTVATPFVGVSTGSAIIGAYGVGIQAADLQATDQLFDLTNSAITPPNNVVYSVGGLVSGEDRVLVAPWDGTTTDAEGNPAVQFDQLSLNTTLSTDNITSVVVSTAIPSDTPSTGYIRVADDNGFYRRLHFSSWTGSTFTVDSTDGQEDFAGVNATAGNNVWIAYIDELASGTSASFTVVYSADRDLVVKVRDGGASPIKEFITSGLLSNSGGSVTAIRTSDS